MTGSVYLELIVMVQRKQKVDITNYKQTLMIW